MPMKAWAREESVDHDDLNGNFNFLQNLIADLAAQVAALAGGGTLFDETVFATWFLGLPASLPASGLWWNDGGMLAYTGGAYSGISPVSGFDVSEFSAWLQALPTSLTVSGRWWNDGGILAYTGSTYTGSSPVLGFDVAGFTAWFRILPTVATSGFWNNSNTLVYS